MNYFMNTESDNLLAVSSLPVNRDEASELSIGTTGMIAKRRGDYVAVVNRDETEIFTFNAKMCPFEEEPIYFLIEVYTIGYNKGRIIGRDLCKARIRELLGGEI
jgi:hypothetical protein